MPGRHTRGAVGDRLAFTGGDVTTQVLTGLLALVLGLGLTVAGHRRRAAVADE
jgi:hypothetical protein